MIKSFYCVYLPLNDSKLQSLNLFFQISVFFSMYQYNQNAEISTHIFQLTRHFKWVILMVHFMKSRMGFSVIFSKVYFLKIKMLGK